MRIISCICVLIVLATAARPQAYADETERGAIVFRDYCANCHSVEPHRNLIGPSLFGVVGRQSGHVPGFDTGSQHRIRNCLGWGYAE